MAKYSIGLDFGTESARAVLVDTANGAIIATAVEPYKHGVIDDYLITSGEKLAPDWALQWPGDWLESTQITIQKIMQESKINPNDVIGIGLDFTACTILPTLKDGTPLCELEKHQNQAHAFAKLWKHHAAQPQADKVNELAKKQSKDWLARYGGIISSEWLIPKALEIVENAPQIYEAADY
ncbi:MAG TPA: ribulokinase, partial [Trueperaceae bacterium]|nr:ribulokinase [Trueperaceae bacterium]